MTTNKELVLALRENWREAPLSEADRAMLTYSEKLTLRPQDMIADDVQALRRAGFSDAAILDIAQVVGYYAFANRLADGLGVELEPYALESEQVLAVEKNSTGRAK